MDLSDSKLINRSNFMTNFEQKYHPNKNKCETVKNKTVKENIYIKPLRTFLGDIMSCNFFCKI